jgi:galactokinase
MTVPTSRIAAELERVGMPAGDLDGRVRLVESAALEFSRVTGRQPEWTWWVPGRIELFGKHTDYAGGRSLVAAVPRGFAVVAGPRDDAMVAARDAHWQAEMQCSLEDDHQVFKGWTNYVAVVARRLARNFPGARLGTDIVFASDLPRAAGISSSSALVVGVALALARRAALIEREDWRGAIGSTLDLAGYLGAVENGLTFGPLAGTAGVGTHGGSEDHTAILNAKPETFSAFSYVPVRPLGTARLPDAWRFVVMSSGVEASKAGEALGSYNRASLATRALTETWARHSGQPVHTLAAALASASLPDFERAIGSLRHPDFSAADLSARLAHFVAEDARVPAALAAIAGADESALRALSTDTQRDAGVLLDNQIPETNVLAALAHEAGAFAASSFGAGFGGSVWAMVRADEAAAVVERWQARYLEQHAPPKPVTAFIARPAPAASELFLSE